MSSNTSQYADKKYGIKSVKSLDKWYKENLLKNGIIINIESVKVDRYIYTFFAINNNLHKIILDAHVIYCLKTDDCDKALNDIINLIKNEK